MTRRAAALFVVALLAGLSFADIAPAQTESKSAMATRKKLLQKIEIDAKETGTKDFLEEALKIQPDQPIRFFIDNASGVSNNTKVTLKLKDVTVEKALNDFCDKMDCGWFVESNVGNNMKDGRVVVRKNTKGKERGYEFGKEPKKKASAPIEQPRQQPAQPIVEATRVRAEAVLAAKRD